MNQQKPILNKNIETISKSAQTNIDNNTINNNSNTDRKVRKIYVPDTNVLMTNNFAVYILSGNEIPDDDAQKRYLNALKKKGKEFDPEPNNVLICDIVSRELNKLKNDYRINDFRPFLARLANRALEDMAEEYDINQMPTVNELKEMITSTEKLNINSDQIPYGHSASWLTLENGANIIFATHNEKDFNKQNIAYLDSDDRILYQIRNAMEIDPNTEYIFVSSDSNARFRAKKLGIKTQDFDIENVRDPNQLYSGITYHPMPDNKLRQLIENRKIKIKISPEECESVFGKRLKPNQVVAFQDNVSTSTNDKPKDNVRFYKAVFNDSITLEYITNSLPTIINKHNNQSENLNTINEKLFDSLKPDERKKYLKSLMTRNSLRSGTSLKSMRPYKVKLNKLDGEDLNSVKRLFNELKGFIKPKNAREHKRDDMIINSSILYKNLRLREQTRVFGNLIPYYNLLNDDNIKIISVNGEAGTGKTYFALIAGMTQLMNNKFDSLTYFRALVEADSGIGYLKGTKRDKMEPWAAPCIYNLKEMFGYNDGATMKYKAEVNTFIDSLETNGMLEFEPMTFQAGNTLRNRYIIIDEAQLLTKDLIKLLVGRVGEDSKIVFIGDLGQIATSRGNSSRFINERNSGFAHLVEQFPGQEIYGHVVLDYVERSNVAKLANLL
jgi:predicted ribonuclease YlaK